MIRPPMWFSILFGLFLSVFSAAMLRRNRTIWRSGQTADVEQHERDFLDRQSRRRGRANWIIGVVGLAVIASAWLPTTETTIAVAYWLGVALLVCWTAWLAVADLIATRVYFGRLRRDHQAERARLEAELARLRHRDGNGRPKHEPLEELE